MTHTMLENFPVKYARIAGLLYLIIAVFGAFSIGYVPSVIYAAGDVAQTAENLLANQGLFNMGVLADVVVLQVEIILTVMLYWLLKPVSPTLSMIATLSRFGMIVVMGLNILIHIMPALLLSGSDVLAVFDTAQLQASAFILFEAHALGIFIWQLFFSLHLLVVGYLVAKSGYFPKVLGWMMGVGSFGYLVQALAGITQTENGLVSTGVVVLLVLVTLGELGFAFWLLIKGMNVEKWRESVA